MTARPVPFQVGAVVLVRVVILNQAAYYPPACGKIQVKFLQGVSVRQELAELEDQLPWRRPVDEGNLLE